MRNTPSFVIFSSVALFLIAACDRVPSSITSESERVAVHSDIELMAPNDRAVDVRVFSPSGGCAACPLIIFSHGAYATYDRYDVLLKEWARNGYVVAAPLHVDSEEHPNRDQYGPREPLKLRVQDYETVASELSAGANDSPGLESLSFSGEVIAAGHSYGALIAQVAGGARLDAATGVTFSPEAGRPLAVIAISPPSETANFITAEGWAQTDRPMLVVTGTEDITPDFIPEWEMHLASYEAAPAELAYALIFDGMDHYFNGAFGRPTPEGIAAAESVKRLNKEILTFTEAARNGYPPTGAEWLLRSRDGVEARTRKKK